MKKQSKFLQIFVPLPQKKRGDASSQQCGGYQIGIMAWYLVYTVDIPIDILEDACDRKTQGGNSQGTERCYVQPHPTIL